MAIYQLDEHAPQLAAGAWVADSAQVMGNVLLGENASVWFGCVLRGDVAPIVVGARSNIQDNTVIHGEDGCPTTIGEDVTVGHSAIIHASRLSAPPAR